MAVIATCVICGNDFQKLGPAKTCSKICQYLLKQRRNKNLIVKCVMCKSYFRKYASHKTCSAECSTRLEKQKNKIYKKRSNLKQKKRYWTDLEYRNKCKKAGRERMKLFHRKTKILVDAMKQILQQENHDVR